MTTVSQVGEPQFLTLLADRDGWCRWIGCADGYDLGGKTVHVLITIDPEGSIKMATRPDETCSWSPPIYLERRVW